jgi:HD-GYP domain-containing protein (c-di-GMP phosphodiesterase class II)
MNPISFRSAGSSDGKLELLSRPGPLTPKLKLIHALIRHRFKFVDRIAVAVFDPYANRLKTYVSSNSKEDPLERYEFPLIRARSLLESLVKGPRVINDLSVFSEGRHEHTRRIYESGFQASYTVPLLHDQAFQGFIFLNSFQKNCFTEEVVEELDVYCYLIRGAVEQDLGSVSILDSALQLAAVLLESQATEPQARRGRMTRITRLVTEQLVAAGKCSFDEESIERIARFAAFHDIGKLAVPEAVLMKPERLTPQDFAIVIGHTEKGLEIVDSILKCFHLESAPGIQMLRNIVLSHHEKIDGSGYPHRLAGKKIPMEARIVTVADMYDALTSDRPHRFPLSSEEAFEVIQKQAEKLDPDCVAALVHVRDRLDEQP